MQRATISWLIPGYTSAYEDPAIGFVIHQPDHLPAMPVMMWSMWDKDSLKRFTRELAKFLGMEIDE